MLESKEFELESIVIRIIISWIYQETYSLDSNCEDSFKENKSFPTLIILCKCNKINNNQLSYFHYLATSCQRVKLLTVKWYRPPCLLPLLSHSPPEKYSCSNQGEDRMKEKTKSWTKPIPSDPLPTASRLLIHFVKINVKNRQKKSDILCRWESF